MKKSLLLFCFVVLFAASGKSQTVPVKYQELLKKIVTNKTSDQLIGFAKTLIGIPYRYASSNPAIGFDCSGFVSYVFHNFGVNVPRSSTEFNQAGTPVKLENAKVGDVLIFTGTNPRRRVVGHVGIIADIEGDTIKFIHSTSGKAHGVTVTTLNPYYKSRLMRAVSIL
ncbi:cell wall-associated NlpC family hydrolase [Pedobacter cryoconitis]|uniref:Cell wall-associated NlpC family hydrolase n=1 Tax=Pedobacter cryoconitis TaxID=188932 RepID=A0A7W9E1N8_9SPHI|nr:C40 family peptidase [Pedobacter cryoconitis]MBB5639306.1 cell wall-associated NlpC family hydrolase [Pedobacter cryoconitis]MBB6269628.1 cell wall-associated NlpC family hydrolase [Pedobacter cryoconitis]